MFLVDWRGDAVSGSNINNNNNNNKKNIAPLDNSWQGKNARVLVAEQSLITLAARGPFVIISKIVNIVIVGVVV